MMFSGFQLPNITDSDLRTEKGIKEIKDYLYQLQEQLRFVLNNIDLDNLSKDLATQAADTQSMIEKTRDRIALLVSENNGTDQVNSAAIIVAINKGESTAKIIADKIALEGIVTVNGRFWIDENGKMGANGAEINGEFATETTDLDGNVWKTVVKNGGVQVYRNNVLAIEINNIDIGIPFIGLYDETGDSTAYIIGGQHVEESGQVVGYTSQITLYEKVNGILSKQTIISPEGVRVEDISGSAQTSLSSDKSLKLGSTTLTEEKLQRLLQLL